MFLIFISFGATSAKLNLNVFNVSKFQVKDFPSLVNLMTSPCTTLIYFVLGESAIVLCAVVSDARFPNGAMVCVAKAVPAVPVSAPMNSNWMNLDERMMNSLILVSPIESNWRRSLADLIVKFRSRQLTRTSPAHYDYVIFRLIMPALIT